MACGSRGCALREVVARAPPPRPVPKLEHEGTGKDLQGQPPRWIRCQPQVPSPSSQRSRAANRELAHLAGTLPGVGRWCHCGF